MSILISSKVELFFLTFFRWVILLALLSMLIASGYFVFKGVHEYPLSRANLILEKKSPPEILFSKNEFLNEINPKAIEEKANGSQQTLHKEEVDTAEINFLAQMDKLWAYVSKYQADCKLQDSFSKEQFTESLRPTPIKEILQSQGTDYAASQVDFVKEMLSSKEIVDLCKSGKKGIFLSLLDFHLKNWDRQVAESREFENREKERLLQRERDEERRVTLKHEEAQHAFIMAGGAFLIFMSIALVLIFARIESNLRGVQLIKN